MRRIGVLVMVLVAATSVFAQSRGRVLGKIAQALEPAKIYKSPSTKAKTYYTAKKFQYLVVNPADNDRYLKVVMSNGLSGYVQKTKVAELNYQVTAKQVTKPTETASRGGGSRAAAAEKGLNYIGTPYVWGGDDINNGIDCSGFVKKLYGDIGLNLPRTASEQAKVGKAITRYEDLQPGDRLYFWEKKRGKIGHTGMYLGNGRFVHSSRGHQGVNTDVLTEKWRRILVAARR
jgi:cell wall-associated NlpC family hydrolase